MKFYPLALVAVMLAAATANAGETYNYNNTLAECGFNQKHSWINGCCDREPSCCDHLWDGYGCYDDCGSMHFSMPKFHWNSLHMNAAPYQVPCPQMPKFHHHLRRCNAGCAVETSCDEGCGGCEAACKSACGYHTQVKNWFYCVLHNDSCNCTCGHSHPMKNFASHMKAKLACGRGLGCEGGCESGCGGDLSLDYGTFDGQAMPSEAQSQDEELLPPAPATEPSEMKKNNSKKDDNKRNDKKMEDKKKKNKKKKDNKTAGLWLFPSLSM